MTKRWVLSLVACTILALASTAAYGQAVFGNIVGTATDPQGCGSRWCQGDRNQHYEGHVGHDHDQRVRKLFGDSLDPGRLQGQV